MSQQSRILAGVFCSGMAAALIAMAALQLPNWRQQRKMGSVSPPGSPAGYTVLILSYQGQEMPAF